MTIAWNEIGEKIYEGGLDRGVFYPKTGPGVPWNGLRAVDEADSAGAAKSYFIDGQKYYQEVSPGDFQATITAYTYPPEMDPYIGNGQISGGVLVDNQRQKSFGMSYRTMIGNDVFGADFGYKLNLVYNALATPSSKSFSSLGEKLEPTDLAWDITTTPVKIPGFRPSAHLTFDSRYVSNFAMLVIERILYGYFEDPRLPGPEELDILPLRQRQIIIAGYPDPSLLPPYAREGDVVFSQSDSGVYSIGEPSPDVRPVFVLSTADPEQLPASAMPGDIVYVESSGGLFRIGG